MFGFPVSTCCGDTPQDNSFKETWAEFYAENRLRSISRAAARNHGPDAEVEAAVEKTASKVVPRLIGAVKDIRSICRANISTQQSVQQRQWRYKSQAWTCCKRRQAQLS